MHKIKSFPFRLSRLTIVTVLILPFLLVSLSFTTPAVSAFWKWQENFNQGLTNEWKVFDEFNYLEFTPNTAHFSAPSGNYFPYTYVSQRITPEDSKNYEITVKIKYNKKNYNFGAGIVFDDTVFPSRINFLPPPSNGIIKIWPLVGNRIGFKSNIPSATTPECDNGCFFYIAENDAVYEWHELRIIRKNSTYKIKVDDTLYFESAPTNKEVMFVWLGNPEITKTVVEWPDFEVDYINVALKEDSLPILFIPGMFASWNRAALFHQQEVGQNAWTRASYAPDYDGLIQTIESAGYISDPTNPNQNLFSFDYDWRKAVDTTADDLNTYIQDTILSKHQDAKINIVGHSLGGLVGRAYLQKYSDSNLNQLITVGSPHAGTVESYYPWEGGAVPPDTDAIRRLAFELYLIANRDEGETAKETVQRTIPSLKDIMPTFNFLKNDETGVVIPVVSMAEQNDWLRSIQDLFPSFFDLFSAIIGNAQQTEEWLRVKEPLTLERVLNLWQDGKPVTTEFTDHGDGAVLAKSAAVSGDPYQTLELNHGDLVHDEAGIQQITDSLGVQPTKIIPGHSIDLPTLIFAILSPATIKATGPEGTIYHEEDGLIVIPSADEGEYTVEVTGQKKGSYRLISGVVSADPNRDQWFDFEDKTSPAKTDQYIFSFTPQDSLPIELFGPAGKQYLISARQKLASLQETHYHWALLRAINVINQTLANLRVNIRKPILPLIYQAIQQIFIYRTSFSTPIPVIVSQTDSALFDLANAFAILKESSGKRSYLNQRRLSQTKEVLKAMEMKLNMQANRELATKKQALSFYQAKELMIKAEQAFATGNKHFAEILLFQISLYLAEANR